MPTDRSEDLMRALMSKLYKTVTGNDQGVIQMPRNKFISWLMPGIPFDPQDFLFCSKGLIGADVQETRLLQHQAFVLSKMFDYIPEIPPASNGFNQFINSMGQTIWTTTQDTLSSVWNDILRYSKVVHIELSEEEKKKLQKYRDLLTVTKEVEDIVTGEKKTITEPGPLTIAYTNKMNDYLDAADEYMNLLIEAQSATGNDPEAIRRVAAWANKSKYVRRRLEAAYMAWVSQGYKNEYEEINAYINQVTQQSMVLYKQDLLQKFEYGLLTSTQEGTAGDFYYTTLIPGNFATSPGWTEFTFYEGDYESHFDQETSSWGASAGFSFGLFSIGGSVNNRKTEVSTNQKSSNFRAQLEFTQIPIIRSFFAPGFFTMRGWTLDELWYLNWEKEVSDGAERPDGRLVAYATSALFVRNVEFTLDEWEDQSRYFNESIQAGGCVGWGPFSIGGSYYHGSEQRDYKFHQEGGRIRIPGIQLIGFINNIVPKAPNLNPDIKPEQLVGGADREIIFELVKRYERFLKREGRDEDVGEFLEKAIQQRAISPKPIPQKSTGGFPPKPIPQKSTGGFPPKPIPQIAIQQQGNIQEKATRSRVLE
jgi:hypothetical protein